MLSFRSPVLCFCERRSDISREATLARHTRCSPCPASWDGGRSSKPAGNSKVRRQNSIKTVNCSACVAKNTIFIWGFFEMQNFIFSGIAVTSRYFYVQFPQVSRG